MQRVTLILLAALCGSAMAREAPISHAGRELLQTEADCARSVPHCKTCRWQKIGTTTLAVCTQCDTKYVPKAGGRECWCAPGYQVTTPGSTARAGSCSACGADQYCPGAKATWASGETVVACGANKKTITQTAKSEKECVAKPGFGWVAGDGVAATQCGTGTYNPGYNNRGCTRCPGGLTTAVPSAGNPGATSATACLAPQGYYYYRGKAVACAKGYYKTGPDPANRDCAQCPDGFTTSGTASTVATACNRLKPGFAVLAGSAGTTAGTPCPVGYYRSGEGDYSGGAKIDCVPCGGGCNTTVTGAVSSAFCLSPPGYGWDNGDCTKCEPGKYNQGYNREACNNCDANGAGGSITSAEGAITPDECKIPAGYGTTRTVSGGLTAAACPLDTYGRDSATYGLVDVECTKCIDNMHTDGTGKNYSTDCLTDVGYGYDDGASNICDYGYYNAGGNRDPCTYCGDGLNTTSMGSNVTDNCTTAAGWYGDANALPSTLKPCPKGTWKSALGTAACNSCNAAGVGGGDWGAELTRNMTTSRPYASIATTDCDTCLPGYGTGTVTADKIAHTNNDGTLILGADTFCFPCMSGFFSAGGATGGAFCDACPAAYPDAVMQSRPGSTTSDSCIPEFITNDATESNNAEWDYIPMALAADGGFLTAQAVGVNTITLCQAACKANALCMYFNFNITATPPAKTGVCGLLLANKSGWTEINTVSDTLASPANFYILLEAGVGQYVTYLVPGGSVAGTAIGTTIGSTTYDAIADAKAACDADAACVGMTNAAKTSTPAWRLFKGAKQEGTTSKIRVVGKTINSWMA